MNVSAYESYMNLVEYVGTSNIQDTHSLAMLSILEVTASGFYLFYPSVFASLRYTTRDYYNENRRISVKTSKSSILL